MYWTFSLDHSQGQYKFSNIQLYIMNNSNNIFKKVAQSDNTNSFGLYQLILVNSDGEVYITHASMYNCNQKTFRLEGKLFRGCEMTEKMSEIAPPEIVSKAFSEA